MFLAPALYALHAVLTGVAMVVMDAARACGSASASRPGLFDYVLNFSKATRPLAAAAGGAGLFRRSTTGCSASHRALRPEDAGPRAERARPTPAAPARRTCRRGRAFIEALGGAANLRLGRRLHHAAAAGDGRSRRVDEPTLRALGARGLVRLATQDLQVVLGPIADQVAGDIRSRLRASTPAALAPPAEWIAALGGAANVTAIEPFPGRVLVTVKDARRIDAARLVALGARAVGAGSASSVHLLHAHAEALGAELAPLVA